MAGTESFGLMVGRVRGGRMLRAFGGRVSTPRDRAVAGTPAASGGASDSALQNQIAGLKKSRDNVRRNGEIRHLRVQRLAEQLKAAGVEPDFTVSEAEIDAHMRGLPVWN